MYWVQTNKALYIIHNGVERVIEIDKLGRVHVNGFEAPAKLAKDIRYLFRKLAQADGPNTHTLAHLRAKKLWRLVL